MKKNKKNKKRIRAYFKMMKRRKNYPKIYNTAVTNFEYSMNWDHKNFYIKSETQSQKLSQPIQNKNNE